MLHIYHFFFLPCFADLPFFFSFFLPSSAVMPYCSLSLSNSACLSLSILSISMLSCCCCFSRSILRLVSLIFFSTSSIYVCFNSISLSTTSSSSLNTFRSASLLSLLLLTVLA